MAISDVVVCNVNCSRMSVYFRFSSVEDIYIVQVTREKYKSIAHGKLRKNIAQWYIQSKTIMYIQHFDPMSSYRGLPFYITVDNCNYQLIIRASSLRTNLHTRFLITALLSGTWYSTNMVEALQLFRLIQQ